MPVEDIMTGIKFCGLLGTVILCVVLVVSAILRWIKPAVTRNKRLNISAWIAFAILCSMALVWGLVNSARHKADTVTFDLVPALIEFFKNVVWLIMFATVGIAIMALLLIIILAVCKGFHIIIRGNAGHKDEKEEAQQAAGKGTGVDKGDKPGQAAEKSTEANEDGKPGQDTRKDAGDAKDGKSEQGTEKASNLADIIREPVVILSISWGILALFFLIPFMAGGQLNGDIIENWRAGLERITSSFGGDGEDAFVTYALVYIAILGISFAVMKILYSLIAHTFEDRRNQSILDEYSSPIALLAVGVALLWTYKEKDFSEIGRRGIILELGKSFLTVVIIATILILTLEIIRMLIDIRGKLIRQEARYLFIALTGHATVLMLGIMLSICGAVNNAIGNTAGAAMDSVEEKLRLRMMEALEKQIDAPENVIEDNFDDTTRKAPKDDSVESFPQHSVAASRKKGWHKAPTAFRKFHQKVTRK